ncbi:MULTISPECIES: DEAD/DEAH box helicase [Paenalcaligenes]|uniref:DEAD/DEAH box helicase n=1 Tax=Paenalcaligenes hermetiae TaxID=1157987 RepID=A0ABP9M280_9BURK|nr:DEAD/DEAH box helicase [Paenalcaligenes sp.]
MKETNADSTPSFASFGLHPDLLSSILAAGYTSPTPIQAQALPVVMQGRDVMGAAQTGTGKTAAFSLPILHRLMPFATHSASPARHPVRALILTPTRELADQVGASVKLYCKNTPLRSAVVFGGVDINAQRDELRRGCEILIATPGRLLDHIEQKNVNLSQVGIFVLDEADRMLDMGFLPDLDRIVRLLPKQRQSLLFSATFSPEIRKLATSFLRDPVSIEVAARNATADTVTQRAYAAEGDAKRRAVEHIVRSQQLTQVIVFTNTKLGANRLTRQLERSGFKAAAIHGDKSQLERMKVLDAFKADALEILVATDVAARGLDVAGVPCVINYDLPFNPEDYVHRIGRTGRAGAKGEAIALVSADEQHLWQDIQKLIGSKLKLERLSLPNASSHTARARAPQDEIFYKPYQPSTAKAPTRVTKEKTVASGQKKRFVGVLLGGGYY